MDVATALLYAKSSGTPCRVDFHHADFCLNWPRDYVNYY